MMAAELMRMPHQSTSLLIVPKRIGGVSLGVGRRQNYTGHNASDKSETTNKPEEASPRSMSTGIRLCESSSDERPSHTSSTNTGAKYALPFAGLLQRDNVGEDHHGQSGDTTVGNTSDAAKDQKHVRMPRETANEFADCQQHQSGHEDRFLPVPTVS
jgi:hypothetical protein